MFNQKFNKPYYELKLSQIPEDKIHVLSYEGEEEISNTFEYRIKLISEDPELDASKILNNSATFTLYRGDEAPVKIHGIISNFEQYGRTPDYVFYSAVLVPRVWRLNLVFQNEVYQNMGVNDLIEAVLDDIGLTDYRTEFKNTFPTLEYIVQYRETSFNFLNRRLEHFGIYYYFDHSGDKDTIVFIDSMSAAPSIKSDNPIGFNINTDPLSEKESLSELICREKVITGLVQLKDYNYMFPEKKLMAQSQIDSNQPGLYYDFGDHFENEKDAEFLAKVRNQELMSEKKIFFGVSDCRLLSAGYKFKVDLHYRKDWNTEYFVTKIKSAGTQQSLFALLPQSKNIKPTFELKFEAVPGDIEFRPKRKTSVPKISGIMSAKIEVPEGEDIYIDEHGRYKAKMLFDLSDSANGESSLWMRLLQNYSGAGYGVHFPNRGNAELLWACTDGNVDRPVGLGTVPNPSQATPVANTNKTQNIIRTASGNELVMDDKLKEAQISLTTPDANKILFDDKDDKIEIITKDKHKFVFDDKNQNVILQTKEGHSILFDDKNKKIELKSKNEHFIVIDDASGQEKIQLSDKEKKNTFIIDITNKKIVIETQEGNIDMLAPKGEINIKSKTLKLESEGETSVKAANMKTDVKQEYKLSASTINTQAKMDLKQKGMNIVSEASMDHKIKGLNLTTEAGMNLEIKGTMVNVQSTGPNTIKGTPVMIN